MGIEIVIFLLFVSVTLFLNAGIIWLTYRVFANVTLKVTNSLKDFQPGGSTREWIDIMQSASVQAVEVTEGLKEQLAHSEPVLARVQSKLGFGLAKVDVRFEKLCDNVRVEAEKAQAAIVRPTEKIGSMASGVAEVLKLFVETGPDASSRLK